MCAVVILLLHLTYFILILYLYYIYIYLYIYILLYILLYILMNHALFSTAPLGMRSPERLRLHPTATVAALYPVPHPRY